MVLRRGGPPLCVVEVGIPAIFKKWPLAIFKKGHENFEKIFSPILIGPLYNGFGSKSDLTLKWAEGGSGFGPGSIYDPFKLGDTHQRGDTHHYKNLNLSRPP